jgi:acyl-CoA thioester hydrolase
MYQHQTTLRVRYAETDQMGFVYYGEYATYFEVARVEAMRSLGISYKELEDTGVFMPVLDFHVRYIKPGKYDDVLTISTKIAVLPVLKIRFVYETTNALGELLNQAETELVFLNRTNLRPVKAPELLLEKLAVYFPGNGI